MTTKRITLKQATMIKWKRCDGANERNACTVMAVSNACAVPYDEAHSLLKKWGRVDGHRFDFRTFMRYRYGGLLGHRVTHVDAERRTLAQVVRDFPRGTFILRKRGHVFTMRDGWVVDYAPKGARTRITDIWYIEPLDRQ
jgi:hypothetical protein